MQGIRRFLALGAIAVTSCCRGPVSPASPSAPGPVQTAEISRTHLTAADVRMFIAVRGRALQRLEDAINDVETRGGDVVAHVQELTAAEQDAVHALGFDWRSYTRVREEIERLASAQRRREDQRLLSAELGRARDDLAAQLEVAKDAPSRQFLEAQRRSIVTQLEKLERDRDLPPAQAEDLRLLEVARAEIATLQGRQEKLQRRVQDLLRRAAASMTPGVNPTPTAGTR